MLQQVRGSSAQRLDEALRADHVALEAMFRHVLDKLEGGDPEVIRASWLALDSDLRAHMEAEESLIIPRFSKSFPEEAERIRLWHEEIRTSLVQLGIDLDLHSLSDEAAERFIRMLKQHARYEEHVLYTWAQSQLAESERQSVLGRLRAAAKDVLSRPSTANLD